MKTSEPLGMKVNAVDVHRNETGEVGESPDVLVATFHYAEYDSVQIVLPPNVARVLVDELRRELAPFKETISFDDLARGRRGWDATRKRALRLRKMQRGELS